MNSITEQAVRDAAKRYKSLWEKDPGRWLFVVQATWWDIIISRFGPELKNRAEALFCLFRPEFQDPDEPGRLHPRWYDTDLETFLDQICYKFLLEKASRPENQLTEIEIPRDLQSPKQLSLF